MHEHLARERRKGREAQRSAALPIAYLVLRVLVFLNWLGGAAILVLLLVMPNRQWIMSAFELASSPDTERLIWALRAIAALGLGAILLNAVLLKRLLAIVETVREGDPFVAANANRLNAVAWVLLGLQVLSLIIGAIAGHVSTPAHPLKIEAGFSINGWLGVLFAFLLARVFAEGARMRDDLDGTV